MANIENVSTVMNGTVEPTSIINVNLHAYSIRIALSGVWVLASVLGIVGNSLVIGSVFLSKKVRTVTNAFVVNLSVADLWASLSYPWEVVAILSDGTWPLESEVPCIIAAVQLYTGLGASLYSLAMIALNRFMLVTQTKETYQRWYSTGKVIGMISSTWIIACIVYLFPLTIGIGAIGYDPEGTTCSDKDAHPRGPEYNLAQSLGLYPVPMVIIISSYTGLYIHLKRHFRKQKRRSPYATENRQAAASSSDEASVGIPSVSLTVEAQSQCGSTLSDKTLSERRAISRQQLAITKNLFLVFCIFTLLISPYFIALAVPSSRHFALYGVTISIVNSCVNPIIYTINHPTFKVVLRKMIRCRYSEIPEPSDWLKSLLSRRV